MLTVCDDRLEFVKDHIMPLKTNVWRWNAKADPDDKRWRDWKLPLSAQNSIRLDVFVIRCQIPLSDHTDYEYAIGNGERRHYLKASMVGTELPRGCWCYAGAIMSAPITSPSISLYYK